jgi:hypothetical protein
MSRIALEELKRKGLQEGAISLKIVLGANDG